jgi:hypothetical protein
VCLGFIWLRIADLWGGGGYEDGNGRSGSLKDDKFPYHILVEAGSNTSTVTLRVVGGDEKGSLKCETVK